MLPGSMMTTLFAHSLKYLSKAMSKLHAVHTAVVYSFKVNIQTRDVAIDRLGSRPQNLVGTTHC